MKTLQEIKDEYAGEQGRDSWDEFFEYCELTHTPLERMQYHHDEVAKRFAREVAKEAFRNAYEATKDTLQEFAFKREGELSKLLSESILNEKNIPKIC